MEETMEQKIERLTRNQKEHSRNIDKLLCERDPSRNDRFWDKRNKIQKDIVMAKYHLDQLEQQAKPLREKVAKWETELKQLQEDHDNYRDHIFQVPKV